MIRRLSYGLLLMLVFSVVLVSKSFDTRSAKTSPTTIYVPHDYPTIQEAINNANDGDTITVSEGSYDEGENLIINRTVTLTGQNSPTIKTRRGISADASNVSINGFTIIADQTPYSSISIYDANCTIKGCGIGGIAGGIRASWGDRCIISNNYVSAVEDYPSAYGIEIVDSKDCLIVNNTVANFLGSSATGIFLASSTSTITGNNILNNIAGITVSQVAPPSWPPAGEGNRIYHNNLENNSQSVAFVRLPWQTPYISLHNFWDDGYPSGGNYYDSYSGIDIYSGPNQNESGSDGIGDHPYFFDDNNTDYYPLMNPHVEFSMSCTPTCPEPFVFSTVPRKNEPVQIGVSIDTNADRMALFYRVNGYDWWSTSMQPSGGSWILTLPGQPANSTVEFCVTAYVGSTLLAKSKTSSYVVKDLFVGDLNGDGTVNILDITLVAKEFGKK